MRCWCLLVILAIGGCEYAVASMMSGAIKSSRSADAAKREQQRLEFQQTLRARAGAWRVEAGEAAKAGDCARVAAISEQVRYLPITEIEGGYHDTVFLANPEIGRCLAKHRDCVQRRLPECTPPTPVVITRTQCVTTRTEEFERTLTEPFDRRLALLARIPRCDLEAPTDGNVEQAWQWLLLAATAASRGECTAVIELDARVAELDREVHDLHWSRDPSIARCKDELITYRTDRERCLRGRAAALREAQTITDTQRRGEALTSIPKCPPVR